MPFMFRDDEGKKVVLSVNDDTYLAGVGDRAEYHNSTRGEDLRVHTAKSGKKFYYIFNWTRWQGESDEYVIIEKAKAEMWIEEHIQQLSKSERETCIEEGILSLEEDA